MNHEVVSCQMTFFVVTLHVRFMKYVVFKAFGPLTRCKPNMNKEEWMHEKMDVLAFFFLKWPKRDVLFLLPSCVTITPSSSILSLSTITFNK